MKTNFHICQNPLKLDILLHRTSDSKLVKFSIHPQGKWACRSQ